MSEKLDRRARDFSKFDSMTTEQLQQILRLDAMKPESEKSDTEELFYIMEVLADRRRNDSNYSGKTAQQAFEDFQKYYMPEAAAETANAVPERRNKPSVRWLHRLGTFAAALVIVFLTTLTANAFGFDLFGKVAKWSADFFHFEKESLETSAPDPDMFDELEYTSLQQALEIYKITHRLAPTWIPEGYTLSNLDVIDSPTEVTFFAIYSKEESNIRILIRQLNNEEPIQVEKNDDFIQTYSTGGITYYLFENINDVQAIWVLENFECVIAGSLTLEELKEIIDSI